jgi:hypothetical protein
MEEEKDNRSCMDFRVGDIVKVNGTKFPFWLVIGIDQTNHSNREGVVKIVPAEIKQMVVDEKPSIITRIGRISGSLGNKINS